ncbi:exportin-7-like [Condylostylus longicornis]|uniref:exportin-7-like n=1 Tax=Condylostylus longicornis TaxID=2530218 RepID=UPI00244E1FBC|nr:exportin-7-like [Condylostylus longicornis]
MPQPQKSKGSQFAPPNNRKEKSFIPGCPELAQFSSGNFEAQQAAHDVLLPLVSDPNCLPQLQVILAQSHNPHALIFASSGLNKLISSGWNRISDTQKDDTRKFVLNYLNITEQVRQFLQSSTPHWVVGLTIYTSLTEDMQPTAGGQLARFRRTAMSFRETALSEIFETATQTLQQLNAGTMHFGDGADERLLLRQVLQLTLNCLNFDFMGTVADEGGDDQTTVMIPHSWSILREERIPQLFFDIYAKGWSVPGQPRVDCSCLCLQCLVLIAAIRRSFFQKEEDRVIHVSQLIDGTSAIIQSGLGLQNDECYHELCSKSVMGNESNRWVQNLAAERLPVHDKKSRKLEASPQQQALFSRRMKVAEAVSAMDGNDLDYEDPLTNEVMRGEQLSVIHNLSRCSYVETCTHVMVLFRESQTTFREGRMSAVRRSDAVDDPLLSLFCFRQQEFQQKMTWLVYIMGSLINVTWLSGTAKVFLLSECGLSARSMEEDSGENVSGHRLIGEMSLLVFGLISETDKLVRQSDICRVLSGMQIAFARFIASHSCLFYFVVFGRTQPPRDWNSHTWHSWNNLGKFLGSSSTTDVLNLMVEKLCRNLERRIQNEAVVKRTLQILNQSATGASVVHAPERVPYFVISGKLLLQSQLVQDIIMDHQNPRLAFLSVPQYGKFRTSYYSTLTRLLLMDSKDDLEKFEAYMKPFRDSFEQLDTAVHQGALETPYNRQLIIHLARDLRGVVFAAGSTEAYNLVFDWLVNKPKQPGASRIDIFTRAVDLWWADHLVMVPTLKFMVEMVHNKSGRICFDANSPNGIFLFKVSSTLLLAYGQKILSRLQFQDLYRQKYKGIACALQMFSHALSGGYTNFGIFEVYNDNVLASSLALAFQLCLVIPNDGADCIATNSRTSDEVEGIF